MSTLDASFPHFFQLQSGESKGFHELMFQQPLTSRIMEVDDVTTLNTFFCPGQWFQDIFFFCFKRKKGTQVVVPAVSGTRWAHNGTHRKKWTGGGGRSLRSIIDRLEECRVEKMIPVCSSGPVPDAQKCYFDLWTAHLIKMARTHKKKTTLSFVSTMFWNFSTDSTDWKQLFGCPVTWNLWWCVHSTVGTRLFFQFDSSIGHFIGFVKRMTRSSEFEN